jgi:ankyrin repeat protein
MVEDCNNSEAPEAMTSSLDDFALAIDMNNNIESLIANGSINIHARLPRSHALMHAVKLDRHEIVTILLKAGARVDESDDRGHTAWHAAPAVGDRTFAQAQAQSCTRTSTTARTPQGSKHQ